MNFNIQIPKKQDKLGYTVYEEKEIYNISNCLPTLSMFDGKIWYDHPYTEIGESNFAHISNYQAIVKAPEGFTIVATGDEFVKGNKTEIHGNNLREFAMLISKDLKKITNSSNGKAVNYYYLNFENNTKYAEKMLSAGVDAFKLYGEYFGDYIHSELDIVQTFYPSAMEFSGLIMLGFPDVSPEELKNLDFYRKDDINKQSSTAHEVGHQWFYSAVGSNPYLEPWLDEGITEFCEDILYQGSKPDIKFSEMPLSEMDNYIKQVTKDKYIINKSLTEYAKAGDYSSYVYEGGKMFLYELKKTLGEEKFQQALREYYNTYKYKIAHTEDFINIIKKFDNDNKTETIISKYIDK